MKNSTISIIGLGYVGLPLAVEFGKKFKVFGFDIDENRVRDLNSGVDITLEVESSKLKSVISSNSSKGLTLTTSVDELKSSDIYIVTVPTPVDDSKKPNFAPLISASKTVGKVISKGKYCDL